MPAAMGGGTYTTFLRGDGPAGGMMAMPAGVPAPPHWLPHFAVADVDAASKQATSLGAQTRMPPTDIPGAEAPR